MKSILKILAFVFTWLAVHGSSFAAVGVDEAEKLLVSEYIISEGGRTYEFKITPKMKVSWKSDISDTNLQADLDIKTFENSSMIGTLPLVTLTLMDGSDEDSETLVIRLSFSQDSETKRIYLYVVDAIQTFNDGPNETTSVSRVIVNVKRRAKSGKFVTLRRF